MNKVQLELIKAALAALSQNATFQSDVDLARRYLSEAIALEESAGPPVYVEPVCAECGEPLISDDIDAGETTCLDCAGLAVQAEIWQESPLLARVRVALAGEGAGA